MKRVSFEVAKALKEAGYPQDINVIDGYDIHGEETVIYSSSKKCEYIAPTYLEVWLWLCREKKIFIEVCHTNKQGWFTELMKDSNNDPEEAIEAAIRYLVDNDLIK